MATTKTKELKINIPALNLQSLKVTIEGTAPLIFHKWDEKAIQMMLDKQMKTANAGKREIRDLEAEAERTVYKNSKGEIAFPAGNIKQAIVGSGRFINSVPMTILRGSIFIFGDKDQLIPVKYGKKSVRRDMVTVGMGSADIRARTQVDDWTMELLIQYDADLLSPEQVINLLQRAGFSQGLGEWRPEKNGDFGTFTVKQEKSKKKTN